MPRAASRDPIYRRRRYTPELIELCVRWYPTYRLSYRDLSAMMAEREVAVSHTTIMRWVRHYVGRAHTAHHRVSSRRRICWVTLGSILPNGESSCATCLANASEKSANNSPQLCHRPLSS